MTQPQAPTLAPSERLTPNQRRDIEQHVKVGGGISRKMAQQLLAEIDRLLEEQVLWRRAVQMALDFEELPKAHFNAKYPDAGFFDDYMDRLRAALGQSAPDLS